MKRIIYVKQAPLTIHILSSARRSLVVVFENEMLWLHAATVVFLHSSQG